MCACSRAPLAYWWECRTVVAVVAVAQDCVYNLTSKIQGDDSRHMLDVFEDFHTRKIKAGEKYGLRRPASISL